MTITNIELLRCPQCNLKTVVKDDQDRYRCYLCGKYYTLKEVST